MYHLDQLDWGKNRSLKCTRKSNEEKRVPRQEWALEVRDEEKEYIFTHTNTYLFYRLDKRSTSVLQSKDL